MSFKNDSDLQNSLICHVIDIVAPNNDVTATLVEELKEIDSYDEKIQYAIKVCPAQQLYSNKFIESIAKAAFDRLKIITNINGLNKVKAPIELLRPKETPPFLVIEDNYGLDKFTESPVIVHFVEGNHVSIIENKDCANIINRSIQSQIGIKIGQKFIAGIEKQKTVEV